jgi:hypothetical protein
MPTFPGKAEGGYAAVFGVNRAAGLVACDYWVHLDMIFHLLVQAGEPPIGTPTIITHRSCWKQTMRNWPSMESWPWLDVRTMDYIDAEARWRVFSCTTAPVAAAHLGYKHLDAYGVDWNGTTDYDGKNYGTPNRGEDRWRDERKIWDYVTRALASRGVTLRRVGYDAMTEAA